MPMTIDDAFGTHAQALLLRSRRAEVLAANIANADTPGYKARDIDFRSALQAARATSSVEGPGTVRLRATHAAHAGAGASGVAAAELLYRWPLQPAVDGNTVDAHVEKGEFMRNSVLYSASLTFLNARVNGLLSALRAGEA